MSQPTLETARLFMRPFVAADTTSVQNLAGDRAIADTTLTIPHPYPDGAAAEWIATHAPGCEAGTHYTFALELKDTQELVGAMGLKVEAEHGKAELGYWIGRPYWGNGYATEASARILQFGFDDLSLNRIQARHMMRNPASGRVLEKIGMLPEGILRESLKKWGIPEDVALFAVLRSQRR